MKIKIIGVMLTGLLISATNLTHILNSGSESESVLDISILKATAQSTPEQGESLTWDELIEYLNEIDDSILPESLEGSTHEWNAWGMDDLHKFCDALDLIGDPSVNPYGQQTDDCDGQPNRC